MSHDTIDALIGIINKQSSTISSLKSEIVELKLKNRNPTLCYIVENYKDAPSLEPIKDYSIISFLNLKINWTTYIGNLIINHYKKDNKNEQSLWYSDIRGGTFYIRENDNWKFDRGGIQVTKIIINPMLDYMRNKCKEAITELFQSVNVQFGHEKDHMYMQIQLLTDIFYNIDNGILHKKIVRYIALHFYSNEAHEVLTENDRIEINI